MRPMASVYQFKAELAGWDGGPGITLWNAYAGFSNIDPADIQEFADRVAAFYNGVKGNFVNNMSVDVSPEVKQFDIATGNLEEVNVIAPPAQVLGTGASASGALSRATMVCVRLKTDRPWYNRLLQGRHFHGPIVSTSMASTGEVNSTTRTTFQNNYNGMLDVAGPLRLVVWSRPKEARPGVPARPGEIGNVQQVIANRTPGTLRSRKT